MGKSKLVRIANKSDRKLQQIRRSFANVGLNVSKKQILDTMIEMEMKNGKIKAKRK